DHIIRICCREGIYDRKTNKFHRIYIPFPFMGKRLHRPGWRKFVELGKIRMFRIPFRFSRLYREWLRLHTNACGDFTMMARDDWFDLRGYPELEMFSLHVDSLLCYIAYSAEIKEVVLDYPIFHIEHSEGWTPEVERDRSLYDRLDKAHIPRLTMKQLDDWVAKMCREREPIIFNDENWGLADENMSEVIL
ncbi:MAG: hypothetical protein SVW57_06275, partial [Thermodesulfobacteriota bacterium]|nr:hypothetical protein [Thermodesulfobacteriota bacterium]